jgi:hypothetical protein
MTGLLKLISSSVQPCGQIAGGGNGRIYSVEISCKDKLPLSASTTVTVTVPHDQEH